MKPRKIFEAVIAGVSVAMTAVILRLNAKLAFASILAAAGIQCAHAAACATAATLPGGDWTVGFSADTDGGDHVQLTRGPNNQLTGTYTTVPHSVSNRCPITISYVVSGQDIPEFPQPGPLGYSFSFQANTSNPPPNCASSILFRGTVEDAGCHRAAVSWSNDLGASGSTYLDHPCYYPTTETTPVITGFGTGDEETITFYAQRPYPDNYDWGGRMISEASPQAGTDTCWFNDPEGPPQITTVTGNAVPAQRGGTYFDHVGANTAVVTYYRAHRRAPCGYHVYQSMRMQCDVNSAPITYKTHVDQAGIGTTAVTNVRAGVAITKTWIPPSVKRAINAVIQFLLGE